MYLLDTCPKSLVFYLNSVWYIKMVQMIEYLYKSDFVSKQEASEKLVFKHSILL